MEANSVWLSWIVIFEGWFMVCILRSYEYKARGLLCLVADRMIASTAARAVRNSLREPKLHEPRLRASPSCANPGCVNPD